jgi:hypothetical protein
MRRQTDTIRSRYQPLLWYSGTALFKFDSGDACFPKTKLSQPIRLTDKNFNGYVKNQPIKENLYTIAALPQH